MLGLDRVLPSVFPPHFMLEWDHGDSREVDQVMGAFFLVRRALFETLGGFDERFFVYFEEADLSCGHAHGVAHRVLEYRPRGALWEWPRKEASAGDAAFLFPAQSALLCTQAL